MRVDVRVLLQALLLVLGLRVAGSALAAATYGVGSGLPNLSVTAMARDHDGLIWLGTEDGLVRFDGHRFIDVSLERGGQLPDTYVAALLATPDGMYVATRRALVHLDLGGTEEQRVEVDGADLAGVMALAVGSDGAYLAATQQGQLWRWTAAGRTPQPLLKATETAPPHFNSIHVGATAIWLAAREGVYRFEAARGAVELLRFDAPELDDGVREAQAAVEFPKGTLWIGYWNDGLARVDLATGSHHWYHPGDADSAALRATSVYTLAAGNDRLYIASNRGLVVYRSDCDCLRGLNLPNWDAIDGSGVIVQSLLPLPDGVWAGMFGEGVVRFDRDDEAFHNQVRVAERNDRLAQSMVRALAIDADARLWIGSYGGGVQWVGARERVIGAPWTLHALNWEAPRIEARYLWSIEATPDGLLLGTGLGLYESRAGRVRAIDPAVERIRCSLQTGDGRRYVGAMSGLYRLDEGRLRRIEYAPAGADPVVWSIAERGDELWLGTAAGLVRLDRNDRVLARYAPGYGPDHVPGTVLAQRQAADGSYWLGTEGGLAQVVGSAPLLRFVQPPALQQARVRNVASIEFDQAGSLWLGTSQGLVRYNPRSGDVRRYLQRDGLFGNQFNIGASAHAGGRLFFGGMGGMVDFDPAELVETGTDLRPQLTRLRIGNGVWMRSQTLQLPARHESLQLEFSSGEYTHAENVRYALRWRGLSAAATDLGAASSAVVERLPAGTHTLELQAQRIDIPGSLRTAAVLTVVVARAWHETWWGRGALGVLVVLSVVAFTHWRTRTTRRQRERLAREVEARTQELNLATDALRRTNLQLQAMALIDPLTGLANRRQLFKAAKDYQDRGRRLAVAMIDLDHFKDCNDRYGHALGDRVLREFAQLLSSSFDGDHLCARYGGEEFVCLCPEVGPATLEQAVLKLLSTVRAHRIRTESGEEYGLTISVGLAIAEPGENFEATLRRADRALYVAKQSRDAHRWAER